MREQLDEMRAQLRRADMSNGALEGVLLLSHVVLVSLVEHVLGVVRLCESAYRSTENHPTQSAWHG
jgi:hypothetical protein